MSNQGDHYCSDLRDGVYPETVHVTVQIERPRLVWFARPHPICTESKRTTVLRPTQFGYIAPVDSVRNTHSDTVAPGDLACSNTVSGSYAHYACGIGTACHCNLTRRQTTERVSPSRDRALPEQVSWHEEGKPITILLSRFSRPYVAKLPNRSMEHPRTQHPCLVPSARFTGALCLRFGGSVTPHLPSAAPVGRALPAP